MTLRRKDSLSMQKNVVNTTEFFVSRVASWGHTATASSFPQHLETQRMRERKTENVMEMSPLKSFPECLFLSCSIIPSLSLSLSLSLSPIPTCIPHTNTESCVAAKKGLCRRRAAGGDIGFVGACMSLRYIAIIGSILLLLCGSPNLSLSLSLSLKSEYGEYDTLDRLYTRRKERGKEKE